jgi:lysyl-tRNA synthetase class 1
MRWEHEKVDFEPAGKDHHSQGGSFDTARHVCKEVYDYDAPVTFRYDFIGIKGSVGKISSSSGEVVDLGDLLKVYTPELVRYLFAGTRPDTEFTISFDLDVIKVYEDYDKTERIAWKLEPAKNESTYRWERRIYELSQPENAADTPPFQIAFRHLCNLVQIADGDVEKMLEALGSLDPAPSPQQIPPLRARALCARYWVDNYAPEEFRFRLRLAGEKATLSGPEENALRLLRDEVISRIETFTEDKPCAEAIYGVAQKAGIDAKALFRAAYQALIGKDQGPRLANFLRSIDKQRLLDIMAVY